jgi:hypothetical protein
MSVEKFMGREFKSDYFPVRLGDKSYQRRPLWGGTEPVDRSDFDKLTMEEKETVMNAEVCQLGALHRQTNSSSFKVNHHDWEVAAKNLLRMFRTDFGD